MSWIDRSGGCHQYLLGPNFGLHVEQVIWGSAARYQLQWCDLLGTSPRSSTLVSEKHLFRHPLSAKLAGEEQVARVYGSFAFVEKLLQPGNLMGWKFYPSGVFCAFGFGLTYRIYTSESKRCLIRIVGDVKNCLYAGNRDLVAEVISADVAKRRPLAYAAWYLSQPKTLLD